MVGAGEGAGDGDLEGVGGEGGGGDEGDGDGAGGCGSKCGAGRGGGEVWWWWLVGLAIWRVAVPVLVRVMVCWVAVLAGDVVEDEGGGVEGEAGVGGAEAGERGGDGAGGGGEGEGSGAGAGGGGGEDDLDEAGGVGGEGAGAGWPPVGCRWLEDEVAGGGWCGRVTVAAVRLVRVKRVGGAGAVDGDGAEVLCDGCEDEAGEREAGAGEGEGRGCAGGGGGEGEGCGSGPVVEGVNWTPSQQLMQGPVTVVAKAEVGGLPWP